MSLVKSEIEEYILNARFRYLPFGFSYLEYRRTEWKASFSQFYLEKKIKLFLMEFSSSEGTVCSCRPVLVNVYLGDELWFAENENLGIFAVGETLNNALEEFQEILVYFYNFYYEINNDELDRSALSLKQLFNSEFRRLK